MFGTDGEAAQVDVFSYNDLPFTLLLQSCNVKREHQSCKFPTIEIGKILDIIFVKWLLVLSVRGLLMLKSEIRCMVGNNERTWIK